MPDLAQTNMQLASQINALLTKWNGREAEFRGWLAGSADGGPNGDGRYPLTNASGTTALVDCPAKLADTVGGPAGLSAAARLLAEEARDAAAGSATSAETAEGFARGHRIAALEARDLALLYRNDAAAHAANLSTARTASEGASEEALAARDEAVDAAVLAGEARTDALIARAEAGVARDEAEGFAASINPAVLATKAELAEEIASLVGSSPETLNTLGEFAQALGDDPNFATTITSSLAGKAPTVHGHGISDVAGLQTALDGKQPVGAYAAYAHGHGVADVTGLQAALDGKQAAGSYAAAGHGHIIADVTGLQLALDGKQAAGSYALASHTHTIANVTGLQAALDAKLASASFTWTGLSGKPTTFAPSAHTHAITDVTGLQAALDAKQASGSYAAAGHDHDSRYVRSSADQNVTLRDVWATRGDGTGVYFFANRSDRYLQFDGTRYRLVGAGLLLNGRDVLTELDGKQPAGAYASESHTHAITDVTGLQAALDAKLATSGFTWAGLSGKPATFAPSAHTHPISDVTGLQTALDGKQAAGSYALASHTHAISAVTGLQAALDAKQASGSYAAAAHSHVVSDVTGLQAALDGKQAAGSYALTGHTHTIANVTGLQAALDGKQAAGSYAAATHSHVVGDVTGLQAALDGKQAAGSYALASHNHDAAYSAVGHTHTFASLTSKPTTLAGYGITDAAASGHNHDAAYSAVGHTHAYLPLTGGILTGELHMQLAGSLSIQLRSNSLTTPKDAKIGVDVDGSFTLRNWTSGGHYYDSASGTFTFRHGLNSFATVATLNPTGLSVVGSVSAGGIELGYRDMPRVTAGIERGKVYATSAGFTLNTGSAAGAAYSVYNDSGAAITITQGSGLTLRCGALTGSRTLAARGFATIWFNSSTEAVIRGDLS